MTVASKRKKLEKKVEASKSLKDFDKMRFNMAIKRSFNIKTLKDVEDEIGETIAKREKVRKSEQLKRMHATKFPQDYPGGITPFKTKGLEAFAKEDYRTKWEKMLDEKFKSEIPTAKSDEKEKTTRRKKLKDFINKSILLDEEDKKEFNAKVDAKDPNWSKIKNDLKVRAKENERFRSKRRGTIEDIKSNEHIPEDQKEKFIEAITKAETPKKLSKIKVKVDIVSEREERKTKAALGEMFKDIESGKDIMPDIPEVKEPEKVSIKKKLVEEIEEAKKKKPEIVSTATPKKIEPTPVIKPIQVRYRDVAIDSYRKMADKSKNLDKTDKEFERILERDPDWKEHRGEIKPLIRAMREEYDRTRKPISRPVPTPTGLVAPSLVDSVEFKKTLKKTIEGAKISQEVKVQALRDLETGAIEPKVLSEQVSIEIEKEKRAGRVVAKPLPPILKLLPAERGYIGVKKTDIVPERYTELLFKDPKVTELDRKRWAQFKQINVELAKRVRPRKIAEEHYEKLVKLKGGNLDLADKAYERYLRSLNLSDSVIAYERRKEREIHERDVKVKGERIVKRLSSGKFITETGREVEIDPDVIAGRSKDPIVIYLGPDKGRTRGGKEVSLRKAPLKDEAIALMDIARGMARTDTGRVIRIDPKIWNKYKAKDKIKKYEIATGLGITESGEKVSLTAKPEDAVIFRPGYISPAKKMEAKRRETRERAYLLAKGVFVRDRKGKDPAYIGLSESLPGERGVLADYIPRDKVDAWINLNVGPDRYHMYQWREFRVMPKNVAETLLRRAKKEDWRKEMEPKKVLTAIEREGKVELEKRRKMAEAVKPLTEKQIREQTGKIVRVPVMKKDEAGVMRMVKEKVVVGDPKLRQIGVIRRAEVKPLTEQEMARIRETGVKQKQMLMEAAQLYQDQLRAQKFLASAYKGKIKPFPKKGYSIYKIMAAYRKRKPPWRLRIRRDYHRDEVHMKFVCTNDYLRGREEVHREVQKILTLMNMRMTPDAIIRDVRPPRVGPKFRWVHIAVKAKKIGEGEIRPR